MKSSKLQCDHCIHPIENNTFYMYCDYKGCNNAIHLEHYPNNKFDESLGWKWTNGYLKLFCPKHIIGRQT